MEMYLYRALNEETKLYNIGIVMANTKEKAKEIVTNKFDYNKYSIYIFSKESICDLFVSGVLSNDCIDIQELCFQNGYRTEKELMLESKLKAIQPLINELATFRN